MLEIKITIDAPELASALDKLAAALGKKDMIQTASAPQPAPVATAAAQTAAPTPPPVPAMPVAPAPTVAPTAPAPQPAPVAPTASVPLATAPQYTVDQIMTAGTTLMDAGRMNDLINLLHTFGVQAVTDLKQEQYGAFVTALRNLGAKI